MNELIRINENGKTTARELYEFLQFRAGDFARWFKTNITHNQFASEGTDYKVFRTDAETPQGGRPWHGCGAHHRLCEETLHGIQF